MVSDVQRFFNEILQSYRSKRGNNLAQLLTLPKPGSRNEQIMTSLGPRLGSMDLQMAFSNQLQDQLLGSIVAGLVYSSLSLLSDDFETAYKQWTAAYVSLLDYYGNKDEATNWMIPVLAMVANDLKFVAEKTDEFTKESKHIRESVNTLSKGFSVVARDRTPITDPKSKKLAIFAVTNVLFKIYFSMNTLQLCAKLVSTVEGPGVIMENIKSFNVGEVVMYKYYTGRLHMYEDRYEEARNCLRFALRHTPANQTKNRQRILASLAPIEMNMGILPNLLVAQKYGLQEYVLLGEAVKSGDLASFKRIMSENEPVFLHHGVYLVLEQVLHIVHRNLFRRIFLIQDTTRLNLNVFQAALETLGAEDISLDEIECLVANLIYDGRIKGYISHEKRFLIVSKDNAFPVSTIIVKPSS